MADAGWHGKVAGLYEKSINDSQVLRDVPENSKPCFAAYFMRLVKKDSSWDIQPRLLDPEHPQHRRKYRNNVAEVHHVVQVGVCT